MGVTEEIGCTPKMVKFSIGIMIITHGDFGVPYSHRMANMDSSQKKLGLGLGLVAQEIH